ncbi:hypothetical protein CERSUDRAFT_77231 [Gelatoporia subvermispora B]|uniref:F-box domain-containing protein n=1 Tax=Ceriporiopsis subvermispora (strain B) TaxID=914234 RepID=M2Q6R7_CERS8|nr:hypothetical protein CERSUDRAFT_77231 [Gelatoporia subvermispora B]
MPFFDISYSSVLRAFPLVRPQRNSCTGADPWCNSSSSDDSDGAGNDPIPGGFFKPQQPIETLTMSRAHIQRLSAELLCMVADYLDIFDILRLRQINKLFYDFTHHGHIWKRLLRDAQVPLPPLPPTTRHSFERLTSLEAERLLTRAYSIDKVWESDNPYPYSRWAFPAHTQILSMVVLPGGQYMVASVTDDRQYHYGIMVYVMDHRLGGCVALAKAATATKAFNLQAKYMPVCDADGVAERGIMISFVRRDFKYRVHRNSGVDISQYTGDAIDPEVPLKYECVTLHISLKQLEVLGDPRFPQNSEEWIRHARRQPHPFKTLALIRTRSILGIPALDEIDGIPYVAVPKLPDRIVFKNLNGGPASVLRCNNTEPYPDKQHTIRAIRMLPCQNQVLVVREIGAPLEGEHVLEIYDIIPPGDELTELARDATDIEWLETDTIGVLSGIQLSDHGLPTTLDASFHTARAPQPITLWAHRHLRLAPQDTQRGRHPYAYSGLLRAVLYPERTPEGGYRYTLERLAPLRAIPLAGGYVLHALVGAQRSLVYMTHEEDLRATPRVRGLRRFCDPGLVSYEAALARADKECFTRKIKVPKDVEWGAVAAMAWDESIGRLCVAEWMSDVVHVLDFSHAPMLDEEGKRVPVPHELENDPDVDMTPLDVQTQPETEEEVRRQHVLAYRPDLPWSRLIEQWIRPSIIDHYEPNDGLRNNHLYSNPPPRRTSPEI